VSFTFGKLLWQARPSDDHQESSIGDGLVMLKKSAKRFFTSVVYNKVAQRWRDWSIATG
jgi:hypothetical protein